MWPNLIFIMRISEDFRELLWPTGEQDYLVLAVSVWFECVICVSWVQAGDKMGETWNNAKNAMSGNNKWREGWWYCEVVLCEYLW